MLETYMVRQPILNRDKQTEAYEILYREDEGTLYSQLDSSVANAIEQFIMQMDSESFLDDKQVFLTFTPNLLLRDVPKIFDAKRLVLQIEDNSIVHPMAYKKIYEFHNEGYRIAVKGFDFSQRYMSMLDAIDIIKLDFTNNDEEFLKKIITVGLTFQKNLVAYNIDSQESYEKAKELGCQYFQGSFIAERDSKKVRKMNYMQSTFFRLVVAVTKDEPDLDEIASIISLDVSLTFALLKLVNSAYFALRNRVKSVKQALITLGIGQLKQWIYLLSFNDESNPGSEELIKLSFLRANFCSALTAFVRDLPASKSEMYLMGMFSTLDVLMEVDLAEVLKEIPISDEIKDGLLSGEGKCGMLFKLVLCYEKADWKTMVGYAGELGIPMNVISQKYFECVETVNDMWRKLMEPIEQKD